MEPIRIRQEIVHPRRNLQLGEEGKWEDSKLIKVRGEMHDVTMMRDTNRHMNVILIFYTFV
jgi:hypothetical protein